MVRGLFPKLKYKILERVRAHLRSEPVIAYVSEIIYADHNFPEKPCIVVAPTTDQFDIVRISHTCGPTLEVECRDILDELFVIDEQYGIDILGAEENVVVFKLKRQPQGIERDEIIQWLKFFADEAVWPDNFIEGYTELILD